MKTFTKITAGYTYDELNESAKEKVKQWFLYDPTRNDIFYENIMTYLSENFKNSDLKVSYSLGFCQGDGLNISGKLELYDFLYIWEASEKERRAIKFYIDNSLPEYVFETNNFNYCYSCKFIDRKYIDDTIAEFIEELQYNKLSNIKKKLIYKFFNDMINYFENLDSKFEQEGYKYLYECDDEELRECCDSNG